MAQTAKDKYRTGIKMSTREVHLEIQGPSVKPDRGVLDSVNGKLICGCLYKMEFVSTVPLNVMVALCVLLGFLTC